MFRRRSSCRPNGAIRQIRFQSGVFVRRRATGARRRLLRRSHRSPRVLGLQLVSKRDRWTSSSCSPSAAFPRRIDAVPASGAARHLISAAGRESPRRLLDAPRLHVVRRPATGRSLSWMATFHFADHLAAINLFDGSALLRLVRLIHQRTQFFSSPPDVTDPERPGARQGRKGRVCAFSAPPGISALYTDAACRRGG